jgi:hypothetical protein
MTGNNRVGAFGLAAGRHLNNHECSVVAISLRSTSQLINVHFLQLIFGRQWPISKRFLYPVGVLFENF